MLALKIALRYLFAKKSHNAINAITLVASCGVAIITATMICMLSVYNGFEWLVGDLCSNFDAELRIEPRLGKTFDDTDSLRHIILATDGVETLSAVLEENILLSYSNRQIPAMLMGVDSAFTAVTSIDSIIVAGEFFLSDEVADYCSLGGGLASQLGAGSSFVRPISAFCPKRNNKIDLMHPEDAFTEAYVYCGSIFMVNQAEYDDYICISSLDFARKLTEDSLAVSAYELRLRDGYSSDRVKTALRLGEEFVIKTRYEQQADSFRIMQIEKWITFLLVIFILVIASFNIIGALSMLIIDKEKEIATLRHLGADTGLIRRVFGCEGMLVAGIGVATGIILGVLLCFIQQQYGIIRLGGTDAYIIDAYPVVLKATDVVYTAICVILIVTIDIAVTIKQIK